MIEQELKNIWKDSSHKERIKFDISRLVMELDQKMTRIDKAIRSRDLREIGATFIGIPLFGYLTYAVPLMIPKITAAITVIWFFYVIYKFRSVQQARIADDYSLSFKQQLENQKTNMKAQYNLLNTVLYWYVLPPLVLNIVFIWTLGFETDAPSGIAIFDHLPMTLKSKVTYTIGLTVFNAFVVWLNKRAVRKTITPLIADITRIQSQLETPA